MKVLNSTYLMISCFESRHVAQNNSVINFAMIVLVGL